MGYFKRYYIRSFRVLGLGSRQLMELEEKFLSAPYPKP